MICHLDILKDVQDRHHRVEYDTESSKELEIEEKKVGLGSVEASPRT